MTLEELFPIRAVRRAFELLRGRRPAVRILFWETDTRVFEVLRLIKELELGQPILLSGAAPPEYRQIASSIELLESQRIIECWEERAEARAPKPTRAGELASAALALGIVDAVVGGVATESAVVLRAGLQFVGLAPSTNTVSIAGLVEPVAGNHLGKVFLMTDTGAVLEPTAEQFVDIARNAMRTWYLISDERPCIAFLSASTKGSIPETPVISRIKKAIAIMAQSAHTFDVDGELQLDAALSAAVSQSKNPSGRVAGRANILVFPDLHSCNIGFKIAEHIGGAKVVPVTQGFAKSFHDVSRGAAVSDLLGTTVLAAKLANQIAKLKGGLYGSEMACHGRN